MSPVSAADWLGVTEPTAPLADTPVSATDLSGETDPMAPVALTPVASRVPPQPLAPHVW